MRLFIQKLKIRVTRKELDLAGINAGIRAIDSFPVRLPCNRHPRYVNT